MNSWSSTSHEQIMVPTQILGEEPAVTSRFMVDLKLLKVNCALPRATGAIEGAAQE